MQHPRPNTVRRLQRLRHPLALAAGLALTALGATVLVPQSSPSRTATAKSRTVAPPAAGSVWLRPGADEPTVALQTPSPTHPPLNTAGTGPAPVDAPLTDGPEASASPRASRDAAAEALDAPPAPASSLLTAAQLAAAAQMPSPHPPRLTVIPVAAPSDIDAVGPSQSAAWPPAPVTGTSTTASSGTSHDDSLGELRAAATTSSSVVYTPAQVRQAYGLGALPAATTANKGAYQGSGQLIVVIDAYHYANAGADLNTFSTKFGLPTCTLLANGWKSGIAPTTLVTLPKAGDSCSFQTVYVTSAGALTGTAPATNSGWTSEINLDVQWVHAIAPNAKIVLIEAADASSTSLINAMAMAAKLGASAITMSYGGSETSQVSQFESVMTGSATWVASSGDNGVQVQWPAVSTKVLAVGGTQLTNVSPRAETAWSGSGGGLSAYMAMPSWQGQVTIPGNPANTTANASKMRRGVPDVAYNASPQSGMYVYMQGGWYSIGGTSAGSPQWASLVAITNAVRVNAGKAAFSGTGFQQALYGVVASSSDYRANLLDVVSGSNGTCATCKTLTGYDLVTGLGSPNFGSLLPWLVALK